MKLFFTSLIIGGIKTHDSKSVNDQDQPLSDVEKEMLHSKIGQLLQISKVEKCYC